MTDEDAFLRAVLDNPGAATPRLVYADWLDDQSDPLAARMAAFLRLETRLAETPERSLNRVRFVHQLQQLAVGLDHTWLATVGHPALEACRLTFQFECPARWDRLTPTDDPRVRHCGSCDRTVHHCGTLDDARRHAAAGDCVAVSPALVRRPDDLMPRRSLVPGAIQLTPAMLERIRQTSVRVGQPMSIPPVEPTGPGIRPTTRDEPEKQRLRRRKPARRTNRVRPEDIDD